MLLLTALFTAYELALASVKPERLKALAEQGRPGAHLALKMKGRMEGSLAVIQVGITLCGAIAAATGGANAKEDLEPWLEHALHLSQNAAGLLALAMVVVPLSAVTIIVSELIPKVFAINNPAPVCLALSPFMYLLSKVLFPAVWCFEETTKLAMTLIAQFMPKGDTAESQLSLGELRAQVNMLRASKVIGVQEEQIIVQASKLSTRQVQEVMLPAADIVMLFVDSPLTEAIVTVHLDLHTRFPITEKRGDPQGIIGYVNFKELILLAKTHPHNPHLREITRPLISFTQTLSVSDALRQMVGQHVHLAIVRDDQQQVVGLVTQEDIFEEMVGEIQDEFDRLPRHIMASGKQWVVGGGAQVGKARQVMNRPDFASSASAESTIDAWINERLEDHPKGGNQLAIDGVGVLIRKVRRHKVTEALIDFDFVK